MQSRLDGFINLLHAGDFPIIIDFSSTHQLNVNLHEQLDNNVRQTSQLNWNIKL